MSTDSQLHNLYDLLCPNENCKSLILKAGKATLEHIEKDHVMMPCLTSKADPVVFQETRVVWTVGDMYTFENIGFSKIPPPTKHQHESAGDFRYLCCAVCEAGPLGYGLLLGSPPVFHLATDRVLEKK